MANWYGWINLTSHKSVLKVSVICVLSRPKTRKQIWLKN